MKLPLGNSIAWSEIDLAPESPGVYAWYSKLVISKADIDAIVRRINEAKVIGETNARAEVEEALNRFVFNPYRENPYQVTLRGQLKPKYSGQIEHEPARSESLIDRLVETPERFFAISEILKTAAPWFTSPLYIGMAINLRGRLRQHKNKIVELRDLHGQQDFDNTADAGFASQVVARNFDPTNLFVQITEVNVDSSEHNDLENILNRINYPIFGRN